MTVLVTEAGFTRGRLGRGARCCRSTSSGAGRTCRRKGWRWSFRTTATRPTWRRGCDRLALIRVAFPATADGRGFSIARRLRALGYTGRLRAAGPLIADQFRMAQRVGFDEVELPDAVAERQPEAHWRIRPQGSYQDRLTA